MSARGWPLPAHVQRLAGDGGTEVGDQRDIAGVGHITELDAVDGLVGGDVHVGGLRRELPVGTRRQRAVAIGLAAGGNVDVDVDTGLLDRGLAPVAADHVVGALAGGGEVERDQRLLGGGATGQEQHRIVVGDVEQAPQVGLGLGAR
ncbi:hypothetical protein G6F31_015874 [Rhizopus arrhizus]|nr:hypothetical protein G6F31_015874 [Rhizopus arrhizus]